MPASVEINESTIAALVDRFYSLVREDDVLGPVFARVIGNEWEPHLKKMRAFWSSLILGSGSYKGNPMLAHLMLAPRIYAEHFERWLGIWKQITAELFPPEMAAVFVGKAQMIAERLLFTIDRHHEYAAATS